MQRTIGSAALILAALISPLEARTGPADETPAVASFAKLAAIVNVQLNPSGDKLLVVRQGPDGRYEVEVRPTDSLAQGGLSFGNEPADVRNAVWLSDDRILVTLRERVKEGGSAGFWGEFFAIFDDRGELKYRLPGDSPQILSVKSAPSGSIYVAYDSTGDGSPDVHKVDVQTGRTDRVFRGNNRRFGFQVDREGEVRTSTTFDPDRFEATFWARAKGAADWTPVWKLSPADRRTFRPIGFLNDNPNELTVIAHFDAQTAGLHVYDISKGQVARTLFSHPEVDVNDVVLSRDGRLLGARYSTDRPRVDWLDPAQNSLAAKLEMSLRETIILPGERSSRGLSIVRTQGPRDPGSFYLLSADGRLSLLGAARPELKGALLADVSFARFSARDGRSIPYYLTRPQGASGPLPLIVMPHGGPWARDMGGWDEWAQMLAADGYAVAQPQFRGSTGFDREHWVSGDRQWGGKMQDDLDDAVRYLVRIGVAEPSRVAMLGWSYGGYAALTAGWRGNGLYRCVVAGAAVSDLRAINAGLDGDYVLRRIQKPTIEGPSPVDELVQANIPILVIHGDIDQTVPVSHGRNAAKVLKSAGRQYRYVEVADLDHQLDKFSAEQKQQVYGEMMNWLSGPCGMR